MAKDGITIGFRLRCVIAIGVRGTQDGMTCRAGRMTHTTGLGVVLATTLLSIDIPLLDEG